MSLPKMPRVLGGVTYPMGQLEEQVDHVMKTPPQAYLDEIKRLIVEVNEYNACLTAHGFDLNGVYSNDIYTVDAVAVSATKKIVIR